MAEKKRLRDKQIVIRLLDEEYEMLRAKCDEFGMSYSDYFRQLILFGSVKHSSKKDSKEDHKKFMYEINHIGGNINQIAHRVNSNRQECKADYDELMIEINHLYHAYSKAIKGDIDSFNEELERMNCALESILEKKNISENDILQIRKSIKDMNEKFNNFMKVGY